VPLISIDEAEKRHIAAVLEACGGDVDKAGPILGVARSTLYKKIKKFDIAT
jgi:transcriptional regulator of acetoin/glycerol metabolism